MDLHMVSMQNHLIILFLKIKNQQILIIEKNFQIKQFKNLKFVKYGKILGRNIVLDISDDTTNLSLEKK